MMRERRIVSGVEFLKDTVCCSEEPTSTQKKLTRDLSDSTGNTVGKAWAGAAETTEAEGFLMTPKERPGLLEEIILLLDCEED